MLEPVESFLAHLSAVELSPNTVRAYAHDLKDFFTFLEHRKLTWSGVALEDIGGYVAWLRLPPGARDGRVVALPSAAHHCSAATVNRKLAALSSFYLFHERHGVTVDGLVVSSFEGSPRRGSWQPMLAHLGARSVRRRAVSMRVGRRTPGELAEVDVTALLEACQHLRDQLLLTLMRRGGLRIGEVLGLRHEDIRSGDGEVVVVQRVNANDARAKTGTRTVPIEAAVIRLYADYLHTEYGPLDSDYVFVNLWAAPVGRPMSYSTARSLCERLHRQTGVRFTMHELRHTYATDLLRRGTPAEMVQKLLGHASVSTTIDTYSHLTMDDTRAALSKAGYDFTGAQRDQ